MYVGFSCRAEFEQFQKFAGSQERRPVRRPVKKYPFLAFGPRPFLSDIASGRAAILDPQLEKGLMAGGDAPRGRGLGVELGARQLARLPIFSSVGVCERVGPRPTMEDSTSCLPGLRYSSLDLSELPLGVGGTTGSGIGPARRDDVEEAPEKVLGCFAVFDGHGGRASALFSGAVLPYLISQHPLRFSDAAKALPECFHQADELLREHLEGVEFKGAKEYNSGCTAVAVTLAHDVPSGATQVTCANLGDSRCVLVKNGGGFVALSEDHCPTVPSERKRIEDAGGFISSAQFNRKTERVLGSLAVTRALGDFDFKMPNVSAWGTKANPIAEDLVTAHADVVQHVCDAEADLALILACDGIWNVFSSEEAASFVEAKLVKVNSIMSKEPEADRCEVVATLLVEEALARGSNDNCTCIVLLLKPSVPKRAAQASSLCAIS